VVSTEILETCQLNYAYDNKKKILNDVNIHLQTGKMYAIIGPSGCGKTTLLYLLGGLDLPTQGIIKYNGKDITENGLEYHKRHHTALIFQGYNLIDYMNPVENVKLTAKLEAITILKKMGLTDDEMKRNVLKLSGGQQQRVAIARALASDAPVLLADEPTGNLDEATASEITEILKESAHSLNKCIVVVSHSNRVAKQADVVFKLRAGRIQLLSDNSVIT